MANALPVPQEHDDDPRAIQAELSLARAHETSNVKSDDDVESPRACASSPN